MDSPARPQCRCSMRLLRWLAALLAIADSIVIDKFLAVRGSVQPNSSATIGTKEDTPLHGARLVVAVAHHNENLAWLDTVAQRCKRCHIYVYTSSRERAARAFRHGTIREVPNVGREWGKYLRFIVDEWTALQSTTATVLFLHAHQH